MLAAKIKTAYRNAKAFADYVVTNDGIESITFWNTATLGAQPDNSFWDTVNPPDQALTEQRAAKIAQLHQWWDSHPGIEVTPGVVLPIQEKGRNTNASSLAIALLTQATTVDLVSVDDYTVSIPTADAITALGVFRTAYNPVSQTWDSTHQALMAATTLQELNAVEMP